MQVDLREFRAAYLAEVEEHLGAINTALVAVDAAKHAGRSSPRELRELMRLLHTIKGLSGMVGVEPIVEISHRMETVLRTADRAGGLIDERALEVLLAGTRAIEIRVRAVATDAPVPEAPAALLAELDAVDSPPLEAPADAAEAEPHVESTLDPALAAKLTASEHEQLSQGIAGGQRVLRIELAPAPAKAERGLTITSLRERLVTVGEIVRVLPTTTAPSEAAPGGLVFVLLLLTVATAEAVATAAEVPITDVIEVMAPRRLPAPPPAAPRPAPPIAFESEPDTEVNRAGVLRVDVARIDDTIEKLSGLIVTRSRLARAAAALRAGGADTRDLDSILVDNARQLRDLRASILRVRMVPLAVVLDRLPLVIRGLGRSTGKQVRLAIDGAGAELDKTVAERIFPALVHLLRNAVDHGIESPDERKRAGKPDYATITITASSRDNRQIEIRIEDDGRGVDRERVAAKAGVPVPADDEALLELLCRPGLSTRDAVDTTSGRGVGMDIVHKVVVDNLGGDLVLETTAGRGTTFIIRVPLTIAIVDAFTLRCAGQRFVVPVPVVEEIIELDPAKIVHGPRRGENAPRFFARRGENVAILDLAHVLDLATARVTTAGEPAQALVVRRGREEPVAFEIERVLGQQETVVRPLLDPLVVVAGVSGSTDLGDGRATLVLDLLALSSRLARTRRGGRAA